MNLIYVFFKDFVKSCKSLVSFVQDFSEDSISKPKLLLAANMLIYLDISINISIMHFVNDLLIYFAVVFFPLFWYLKRLNWRFAKTVILLFCKTVRKIM